MKKSFVLGLFFVLFLAAAASGQTVKMKGYLVNQQLEPVADANIALVSLPDSLPVVATSSDATGGFALTGEAAGTALLSISHISYKTRQIRLASPCDTTMTILLEPKVQALDKIYVTAQRPAIRYDESGNTIVAMEHLKGHETDNAADALRKMPGVMVTPKGVIMLYGEPVRIQLDGVNVKVDAMTLLRSIPAASLSDAELIATPSGRHGEGGSHKPDHRSAYGERLSGQPCGLGRAVHRG